MEEGRENREKCERKERDRDRDRYRLGKGRLNSVPRSVTKEYRQRKQCSIHTDFNLNLDIIDSDSDCRSDRDSDIDRDSNSDSDSACGYTCPWLQRLPRTQWPS